MAFELPNFECVTVAPAGELEDTADDMSVTPSPVSAPSRGVESPPPPLDGRGADAERHARGQQPQEASRDNESGGFPRFDGGGGGTVDLDFEVALPAEGFEGATSPATQVAAMVNDFADRGIYALADQLRVDPANVSLSNLAFCAGTSNNCFTNVSSLDVMEVSNELGTSAPWENFTRNGGVFVLALLGTLVVCLCSAYMCYSYLFDGIAFEEVEMLKPVPDPPAKPIVTQEKEKDRISPGIFDLARMSNRRPRATNGDERSDATFPTRFREDAKESGDRVAADNRFASPASGTTVGGGGGHWTASQFGRKGSEEYTGHNPLRMDYGGADSSGSSNHFGNMAVRKDGHYHAHRCTPSKSSNEEPALVGHYRHDELEGEFKTTNPMFLGRDTGSRSPSPQPEAPAAADLSPRGHPPRPSSSGSTSTSTSASTYGISSLAAISNNPLLGLGASSSSPKVCVCLRSTSCLRMGCVCGRGCRCDVKGDHHRLMAVCFAPVALSWRTRSTHSSELQPGSEAFGEKIPGDGGLTSGSGGERERGSTVASAHTELQSDPDGSSGGASPAAMVSTSGGPSSESPASTGTMAAVHAPAMAVAARAAEGRFSETSSEESELSDDAAGSAWSPATSTTLRPAGSPPQEPLPGPLQQAARTTVTAVGSTAAAIATVMRSMQRERHVTRWWGRKSTSGLRRSGPVSCLPGANATNTTCMARAHCRRIEIDHKPHPLQSHIIVVQFFATPGLMSGRSSRGRNRVQGGGASTSPSGGAQQNRQHQSATARWSGARGTLTPSDQGTGSVSSSSTSTGRIAADVLSQPTTISAESEFSLSEVSHQGAPPGVAEAAAETAAEEEQALMKEGDRRKADEDVAVAASRSREEEGGEPLVPSAPVLGRLASPQKLSPTTPTGSERFDGDGGDGSGRAPGDSDDARIGGDGTSGRSSGTTTGPGRLGLTLSPTNEISPSGVMLSPGTDSEPGSSPSPRLLQGPGRFDSDRETQEASTAAAPGVTGGGGGKDGEDEVEDSGSETKEPARSPDMDARTVSISPQSAASSGAASGLWRGRGPGGISTFPRALGTLDLMQVVGSFSDSESPSDDIEESSPRARAALASCGSPRPRPKPSTLPTGFGSARPGSPINTTPTHKQQQQQQQAPSPLPDIQAGGSEGATGFHFRRAASPKPGHSPGVESTREYSESDEDDDTPGGGMLKGEGLIP
ncbi:unnamed protein product [Scytosiphon promiscuus]